MTEGKVVRRNTNCLQCGKPFDGIRFNLAKRKFCDHPCNFAYTRAQGPARFWEKVNKGPHPKGCWLYTGFLKWDGYGWLNRHIDGKARWLTAHRYAWILTHGTPPEGMSIMHLCDIPACCNPDHLKLGTHQDNMTDAKSKNRTSIGSRSGHAKLKPSQVEEIRRDFRWLVGRWKTNADVLASKYGVSVGAIHAIATGRSWRITEQLQTLHPDRVRPRRAA